MLSALREVLDPETGVNVLDLGLIYRVDWDPNRQALKVRMTLTTPACPLGQVIVDGVRRRLERVPGVAATEVELVFEPRWTPGRISPEGRARLARESSS